MIAIKRPTIPAIWRNVLAVVMLGKAAVVGAGLGIAALGLVDVTTAESIRAGVREITHNHAIEAFSAAGGVVGFVWKLISEVAH